MRTWLKFLSLFWPLWLAWQAIYVRILYRLWRWGWIEIVDQETGEKFSDRHDRNL